jgi:DNA repair protein RecN (Recombination protein N)
MVGRQLQALANRGQVLCVTHLPQVASQADHQLRVSKLVAAGKTRTRIDALDDAARVEELARMLGGTQITARTREHAREMLTSGRRPVAESKPAKAASGDKGRSRGRSGRAGSASGR